VPANTIATAAKIGLAAMGLTMASAAFSSQASNQAAPAATAAPAGANAAAAQPAAATGTLDADKIKQGRDLFGNWSCGACHSLADAGGTGHVGPSFDGDKNLTKAFVIDRVTNGQGPMPAFGGQLTDQEIALLASYIVQVAAK